MAAGSHQPRGDRRALLDWMLWLRGKEAREKIELIASELDKLFHHLLEPLGVERRPSSIADAIANYQEARDHAEQRFGTTVRRDLEASSRWLGWPFFDVDRTQVCAMSNGEGRNRTGDTTVFSRVLYRLSYLAAPDSLATPRHKAPRRRAADMAAAAHRRLTGAR